MLHAHDLKLEAESGHSEPGVDTSTGATPATSKVDMVDRAPPRWVAIMATLFTIAAALCLLTVPVLAMYFQAFPTTDYGGLAAGLTGLMGAAAILGALLFDYVQMRALTGYRSLREMIANRANLWLGALVGITLCIVHPWLGLGPALAAGLAMAARTGWRRWPRHEPFWDFDRQEAISLLSGRDGVGLRLAGTTPMDHAFRAPLQRGLAWMALLVTLAVASALASATLLSMAAIPALALLAFWASDAMVQGLLTGTGPARMGMHAAAATVLTLPDPNPEGDVSGFQVKGLYAEDRQGRTLLSNLHFEIAPGSVVGLVGTSGAGKTLLLRALQDPHDLDGLAIKGHVRINARPLWDRSASLQTAPAILLPETPILLPTSGLNNLTCFHVGELGGRGRRLLEQLTFSVTDAEAICAIPDARHLPGQQRKLLAFARAFLLSPALYLMDRPEDGLNDRAIGGLGERIIQEKRLGRCFLLATDNRALLDLCDQLIVLQDGRIIDVGPAAEVRAKITSGWARLVIEQSLESEDNLVLWIRNLFKRPGDETNRRAVSLLAAEMLALSCKAAEGTMQTRTTFEFKHMKGHCLLRMIDDAPVLSSGALERARTEAARGVDMSPLASILRASTTFDCRIEDGRRVIDITMNTYDPRDKQAAAESHARTKT